MEVNKSWFVYMLLCDQKTFYVGITDDLKNRFFQHKNKTNISTKKFSDLRLVYAEKYDNKYDSARREKQLKGWSHKKKQMLVDGTLGINACTESAKRLVENLKE
jgi:putative endonuclease